MTCTCRVRAVAVYVLKYLDWIVTKHSIFDEICMLVVGKQEVGLDLQDLTT